MRPIFTHAKGIPCKDSLYRLSRTLARTETSPLPLKSGNNWPTGNPFPLSSEGNPLTATFIEPMQYYEIKGRTEIYCFLVLIIQFDYLDVDEPALFNQF